MPRSRCRSNANEFQTAGGGSFGNQRPGSPNLLLPARQATCPAATNPRRPGACCAPAEPDPSDSNGSRGQIIFNIAFRGSQSHSDAAGRRQPAVFLICLRWVRRCRGARRCRSTAATKLGHYPAAELLDTTMKMLGKIVL